MRPEPRPTLPLAGAILALVGAGTIETGLVLLFTPLGVGIAATVVALGILIVLAGAGLLAAGSKQGADPRR